MTRFEFATATRIVFGPGVVREIGTAVKGFGQRALIVTGKNTSRVEPALKRLAEQNITAAVFPVAGEPEIQTVVDGIATARRENCDFVIGFGGGSSLDAGKSIAIMLSNHGELLDYLEVIGRGKALSKPSVPFVAIPTTAGTGSEVTRNAVLASPEHRLKVSLRSPLMLPSLAIIDPELTLTLPAAVTASTGLDALTQLIEPYVCSRANPLVDSICREGIHRAGRSLRRACENGADLAAREDMALASLFGGIALSNAGLGAVHGFAGPIGGLFPAPHGVICANLLAEVITANVAALRREKNAGAVKRYDEVAQFLTGRRTATAEHGIAWVRQLVAALNIPPLSRFGLGPADFPELVANAGRTSSMKANPAKLTAEELTAILQIAVARAR